MTTRIVAIIVQEFYLVDITNTAISLRTDIITYSTNLNYGYFSSNVKL